MLPRELQPDRPVTPEHFRRGAPEPAAAAEHMRSVFAGWPMERDHSPLAARPPHQCAAPGARTQTLPADRRGPLAPPLTPSAHTHRGRPQPSAPASTTGSTGRPTDVASNTSKSSQEASAEEEDPGARPFVPDGPADRAPLPTCSVPAPAAAVRVVDCFGRCLPLQKPPAWLPEQVRRPAPPRTRSAAYLPHLPTSGVRLAP